MTAQEIANAAVQEALDTKLEFLTSEQLELFHRVYPEVTEKNLYAAHDLVERTLQKNKRRQQYADALAAEIHADIAERS